jgi:riboflavin kinase/FMN adenylyltransferase
MTFEPHPARSLPNWLAIYQKHRIANLRDNLTSLQNANVDRVIVEHNAHFASLSPQDFIEKVLVEGLHVKWLMVGEDFCFGAKRAGSIAMLEAAGKIHGFEVVTLASVKIKASEFLPQRYARRWHKVISKARLCLDILTAYPVMLHGQMGRTIGFPTLNLRIAHHRPATGIFIQVHGLADQPLPAVASLGVRPWIAVSVRTHVFDYSGNAYKIVQIEFLRKLRDEEKYIDLETLTAAIRVMPITRAYFGTTTRIQP